MMIAINTARPVAIDFGIIHTIPNHEKYALTQQNMEAMIGFVKTP